MKKERRNRKEKILFEINEAIVREEMAVPIYTAHLGTALFWSGVPAERRQKIEKRLRLLSEQSKGHIRLLKKLRRKATHAVGKK